MSSRPKLASKVANFILVNNELSLGLAFSFTSPKRLFLGLTMSAIYICKYKCKQKGVALYNLSHFTKTFWTLKKLD
jgi:hypothetical protein